MREKLTLNELLALFGHEPEETRGIGSADSAEYLAIVMYMVAQSSQR